MRASARRSTARPRTGCRRVSYGPWSDVHGYRSPAMPTLDDGRRDAAGGRCRTSVSDARHTLRRPRRLMPAFVFGGNGDTNYGLHRVYIFSDRDCVNVVYRGAVVGGPAYAPRTTGPLDLPRRRRSSRRRRRRSCWTAPKAKTFTCDGAFGHPNEAGGTPARRASGSHGPRTSEQEPPGATPVDLWDRSWGRPLLLDGRAGRGHQVARLRLTVVLGQVSSDSKAERVELSPSRTRCCRRPPARGPGDVQMFKTAQHASPCVRQRSANDVTGVGRPAGLSLTVGLWHDQQPRSTAHRWSRGTPRPAPPSTTSSGAARADPLAAGRADADAGDVGDAPACTRARGITASAGSTSRCRATRR